MFDIMLPISIVRAKESFLYDDDYEDFENDSILRYFRKDDQQKIKSIFYQSLESVSDMGRYFHDPTRG